MKVRALGTIGGVALALLGCSSEDPVPAPAAAAIGESEAGDRSQPSSFAYGEVAPAIDAERARWDDAFRRGNSFERAPNRFLVDTVGGLAPGDALDLMTGQGRNALWLASQGWRVTGVDISEQGLQEAALAAERAGLTVELVRTDVAGYDLGDARWDLVTMIYAGSNSALIARAKTAIRPGGLFVVEFFLREDGPLGFTEGELVAQLGDWTIVEDAVVEDVADWSMQRTKLVRFAARKPA